MIVENMDNFVSAQNENSIDRICSYHGKEYKILDVLDCDTLLVALLEDFKQSKFPLQVFVIPGR